VVAALAEDRVLLGNEPGTLRRVRDPGGLFQHLARGGFAVPDTRRPGDSLPAGGRWLVKPARGGGGQGVRLHSGEALAASQILQELVEGVSASASFVADGQRSVILGWTEQRHRPGSFRYAGNVLPLAGGRAAWREVEAIADALTREYGLRGLNGFDFVLRGERPVPLEVNPRYCASMELVERAAGTSLFGLHLAACEGRLPARPTLAPGAFGKAIVYAPRPLVAPDTTEWLARGVRDVPHPGEAIRAGHPVCTVLAASATRALCDETLAAETEWVLARCAPASVPGDPGDTENDEEGL
jgi:predicted ATP-grasp superfamily ATP-dependent carboligase